MHSDYSVVLQPDKHEHAVTASPCRDERAAPTVVGEELQMAARGETVG
jgi:hypothetical protein